MVAWHFGPQHAMSPPTGFRGGHQGAEAVLLFSYPHRQTRKTRKDFNLGTKCNYHHAHSLAVIDLNKRESADTVAASV